MKRILIVFTGGTFSMKIDDKTGGAVPHFSGKELMQMIPDAFRLAEIETYDFGKYPGPHVTPELMLKLSKKDKRTFIEQKLRRSNCNSWNRYFRGNSISSRSYN